MEYINKQIKKEELLGLPGVGKSYILENRFGNNKESIELGFNLNKIRNIISGLNLFPLSIVFKMLFNIKKGKIKGGIKLILVLLERAGRIKLSKNNIIIDEGVCQALWGYMIRTKLDYDLVHNILIILKKVAVNVHYVMISKRKHKEYLKKRKNENKYKFNNEKDLIIARNKMAILLNLMKKNKFKINKINN